MALLLDAYLDHPDIRDERGSSGEGSKACLHRIFGEPEEPCHGKIAHRDGAPLPHPVFVVCVSYLLLCKRPARP